MNVRSYLHQSAARAPEQLAVLDPRGAVTYAELEALANQYASELAARGVRRGDRVVIWSDKSAEVVALMQAVLALAAAYVPLDSASPIARVTDIARKVDAALLVISSELAAGWSAEMLACPHWLLGPRGETPRAPADAAEPPFELVDRDTLAYLLFTSGSSGEPKGVCISHGNVDAFVHWSADYVDLRATDRVANHASFSFDLSVFDLYASFLVGAQVVLVPTMAAYVPAALATLLKRERISVLYAVPTAYILMLEQGLLTESEHALRVAIFAGEPFPPAWLLALARALPSARLLNFYGPTETNVCTAYDATGRVDELPVPIGSAVCGNRARVLRDDGEPAHVGEEGELTIEGPTVMLGYWGQTPLARPAYATGDLVRVLPDEQLAYLGRRDAMLKIRGHRVEAGEVEHALQQSARVLRACVVVNKAGPMPKLKAYVVPAPGQRLSLVEARRLCAERLPKYMVVDELELVDDLPRTSTGKVARRALANGNDL